MKQIVFRKDATSPFTTKQILTQILSVNKGQGANIKDMIEKVDLMDKIDAGPDEGLFTLKDSEYDQIKGLYESNGFPVNNRFFVTVYNDIKEYKSVTEEKPVEKTADAIKT